MSPKPRSGKRPLLLAVAGAAAWFQPEISGDDLWWLLAAGREIVGSGAVPSVDSFSFTFSGQPWMNHEWLWSAVAWIVYRAHPDALAWLNLAVLAGVFALVYAVALRESGSAVAATLATWASAATAHWFFDIRPHVLTLGFVALLLLMDRRPWAPWAWPALILVWVNVHGGFLFGLGVIVLSAILRTAEESRAQRPWIGAGLAALAALCNPWGFHIVDYPLAYLEGSSIFRSISEWLPPGLGFDPRAFDGRFFWLALLSAGGLPLVARRARLAGAVWIVTLAMAATSRRFIPLFAIAAAPLLAMGLALIFARLRRRVERWEGAPARVALAAAATAVALWFWRDVRLAPRPLASWTLSALQPRAGLDYLRALGPPRRPFHDINWGGFITLHAPEIPVFIDGRANTVYDAAIARDYLVLDRAGPGFDEVLARCGIDALLVPARHPLIRALRESGAAWRLVYRDAVSAVLLPEGSPSLRESLPPPDPDAPEVLVLESQRLLRDGLAPEARRAAERAIERDGLFFLAYRELAMACAAAGDTEGMLRAIRAGQDAYPRGRRRFRAFEGIAWERLGDEERALRAYRAARPRGPFESDPAVEARLRALDPGSG